jgi:hypothetical protein
MYPAPHFCLTTGTDVFEVSGYDELVVAPAFKGTGAGRAGYKIYVAINDAGVHYVGCTCTRMSSRLRLGHLRTTKPKNGYHGYKWLPTIDEPLRAVRLYVFYLTGLPHPAPDKDARKANQEVAERIEAELVYIIRAATGRWPLSQHEIHFHNLAGHEELASLTTRIARQLYEKLCLLQPLPPLNR